MSMKRSKSSQPILARKCSQTILRQRSFFENTQEANKHFEKSEVSDAKLEKVLAEAEESFDKGEYETALIKFSRGASLKPRSDAFALGVRKSRIAILNDLKESGDNMRLLNCEGPHKANIHSDSPRFASLQKAKDKKYMPPKMTSRSENNDVTEFKSDTARSIFTDCKKKISEQTYNLKICDGNNFKQISATTEDVKEYLKDRDYFKMKEQNTKEWKKLRSEMNKKVAEKEAIERYEREAKLLEEKNNIRHYCEEQVTLIGRYYQNGKISDVLRFSENFIKYLNKKQDKLLPRKWVYLATAFNYLGRAFIEKGDYEKAKTYGEKLYKVAISSANTELITQSYILSGKIYVKFGKYEEAAFIWEKLIPLIENNEKKAWLHHEIGRCYFEMGKYDTSYKYGCDSASWAEKCSSLKWICSAKVLQGQCEMKRNNYSNAYQLFLDAKKQAEIVNDESILKYISSVEELLTTALDNTVPLSSDNDS
ncbi:hypothetical protein RUM43_008540 [Polyplax serrata]|uniref:Outer dynein arm-docking complex subunit 4 n=1 Tax=Polyplax serrata TaxID=468196 RepID=A0AAN8S1D8_POLSC